VYNLAVSISEEEQRAKMQFIVAFFNDFDSKTTYLVDLYNSGRRDEARILCSCYIDALASALYWPSDKSNFNYVKSLMTYGGRAVFSRIHPKMLSKAFHKLAKRGNRWVAINRSVSGILQTVDRRLYGDEEILDFLSPVLKSSAIADIRRELWRGSFAAIVYEEFRIASVQGFGPPDGITFDATTYHGQPVPSIDFSLIHDCLKRIVSVAKELSQTTGKWFGHDYE
jgi:hypothetical protein